MAEQDLDLEGVMHTMLRRPDAQDGLRLLRAFWRISSDGERARVIELAEHLANSEIDTLD